MSQCLPAKRVDFNKTRVLGARRSSNRGSAGSTATGQCHCHPAPTAQYIGLVARRLGHGRLRREVGSAAKRRPERPAIGDGAVRVGGQRGGEGAAEQATQTPLRPPLTRRQQSASDRDPEQVACADSRSKHRKTPTTWSIAPARLPCGVPLPAPRRSHRCRRSPRIPRRRSPRSANRRTRQRAPITCSYPMTTSHPDVRLPHRQTGSFPGLAPARGLHARAGT